MEFVFGEKKVESKKLQMSFRKPKGKIQFMSKTKILENFGKKDQTKKRVMDLHHKKGIPLKQAWTMVK